MHMIKSLALAFAAAEVVLSQTLANPDLVPKATRDQWCLAQRTECPYICTQLNGTNGSPATESNTCSPDTLAFSCVCSNGQQPNASEYSQTIPYFICTENNNECVTACGQSNSCASDCRQKNPCGAQDPVRVNTSSIATMSATATGAAASGTGTGGSVYTGFGSAGSAAATTGASSGNKKGAATQTMVHIGQVYGAAALVLSFLAGFAIVL